MWESMRVEATEQKKDYWMADWTVEKRDKMSEY